MGKVRAWADIGELPYLRVRLQMNRLDIVLVGCDDEERVAFVVDNDRVEVLRVPCENLARARSWTAFPLPNRHTTYLVGWPGPLRNVFLRISVDGLSAQLAHRAAVGMSTAIGCAAHVRFQGASGVMDCGSKHEISGSQSAEVGRGRGKLCCRNCDPVGTRFRL